MWNLGCISKGPDASGKSPSFHSSCILGWWQKMEEISKQMLAEGYIPLSHAQHSFLQVITWTHSLTCSQRTQQPQTTAHVLPSKLSLKYTEPWAALSSAKGAGKVPPGFQTGHYMWHWLADRDADVDDMLYWKWDDSSRSSEREMKGKTVKEQWMEVRRTVFWVLLPGGYGSLKEPFLWSLWEEDKPCLTTSQCCHEGQRDLSVTSFRNSKILYILKDFYYHMLG